MNFLKYTPYLYLIVGIFLIFDVFFNWSETGTINWLNFILAVLAISMFFFRMKFMKKFQDRNNKS